jgi:hypothetical protein
MSESPLSRQIQMPSDVRVYSDPSEPELGEVPSEPLAEPTQRFRNEGKTNMKKASAEATTISKRIMTLTKPTR